MLDHLPLSRAIKLYQIFPKNLHVDSEQWLFCNDTCFQADIIQKQMADDDAHKMKDKNEASGVNVLQICGFFKPSKHIWKEDDSFAWPLESSCFKEAVDRSKPIQPYGQLEESYEQVQEIHALQEKAVEWFAPSLHWKWPSWFTVCWAMSGPCVAIPRTGTEMTQVLCPPWNHLGDYRWIVLPALSCEAVTGPKVTKLTVTASRCNHPVCAESCFLGMWRVCGRCGSL